jgi:hypothetical protein
MWELGIAHTIRLPDEVLVFRSDDEASLFDLTQFRAFPYEPDDDPVEAKRRLVTLARDRLRSLDQSRSDYLRRCVESLDPGAVHAIMNIDLKEEYFMMPLNPQNQLMAIRLFDLGILKSRVVPSPNPPPGTVVLHTWACLTPFGKEVLRALGRSMGADLTYDQLRAQAFAESKKDI